MDGCGQETGVKRELIRVSGGVSGDVRSRPAEAELDEGSRVEVLIGSKWYPGVVKRVKEGGLYAVEFDDGDKDPQVAASNIRLLGGGGSTAAGGGDAVSASVDAASKLSVGMKIEARHGGGRCVFCVTC
jgi:hypothetical protein